MHTIEEWANILFGHSSIECEHRKKHRKIFKVCLAIFLTLCMKRLTHSIPVFLLISLFPIILQRYRILRENELGKLGTK